MKQFVIFVRKEFHHIFRDRKSLLIIFALPIVQILIFGFALTNEIKNADVGILDLSHDDATQQITGRFQASHYFSITREFHSQEDVNDAFKADKIKLAVIFQPNFQQTLLHTHSAQVQLLADASDPNTATTLELYASSLIREYQDQLNDQFKLPYTISPQLRMMYNPELKGAYIFVPGVMGMILLLISAMMTSIAIVREKELNTMEVILASPLKPFLLILSKAVPYVVISLINVSTIIIISVTFLDLPIRGSLLLLFGICILFIFAAITLGLMISNLTDSQQTAMFISLIGLMMPTLILSGFMFPIENMPKAMRILSNVIPTRWFFIMVKNVMIKGLGFRSIWKQTVILAGMTVFFLLVSWRGFKKRLA